MKNPMQKLRRFFVRSRTFNASAARAATHAPSDDDSDSTRLSGAFIIVLALHIIAVVGVFAFARIKENRKSNTPQVTTTPKSAAQKTNVKPTAAAPKPATAAAPVSVASLTPPSPTVTSTTPKPANPTATTTENKPTQTAAQKATTPAATQKAFKNYVVRKNENPAKIARENGCTYEELLKLNNIKDPKKIQVGQVLKVPVKNG